MTRELVMYSRRQPCPWVTLAKQTLQLHGVPWRELLIDEDEEAHSRLLAWVGFLSVPTLIIAEGDSDLPLEAPRPSGYGHQPARHRPRLHDQRAGYGAVERLAAAQRPARPREPGQAWH